MCELTIKHAKELFEQYKIDTEISFLIGSRASGLNRENSDFDFIAISIDEKILTKEIHQSCIFKNKLVSTEIRLFSYSEIKETIEAGDFLLCWKILNGISLSSNNKKLEYELLLTIEEKVKTEFLNLRDQLDQLGWANNLETLKLSAIESFDAMTDDRIKFNHLSHCGRITELMAILLSYLQLFISDSQGKHLTIKQMTTILLAFQGHITRLSDFQKFAHLPQFNELIKSLNENIEVKINPVFQERILAFIETAINHAKQVRTEHA